MRSQNKWTQTGGALAVLWSRLNTRLQQNIKDKRKSLRRRLGLFFVVQTMIAWCLLVNTCHASAPMVYIGQLAAGLGDGSSCANEKAVAFWNSPSSFGLAADQMGADTTVHLCGTIHTQLQSPCNKPCEAGGTRGHPLTILFEKGAKISLAACDNSNGCLNISYMHYVTLNGQHAGIIENTDNGTALGRHASSVGITIGQCNDCTIQNLTIRNLYVRTAAADSFVPGPDGCIVGGNLNNLTIDGVICNDVHWGFYLLTTEGASESWTISNSECFHADHCLAISGPTATRRASLSGVTIVGNHFHDFANWDVTGCVQFHHDGIHVFGQPYGRGGPAASINDVRLYSNVIDGDVGSCISSLVFVEASEAGYRDWKIVNNVFLQSLEARRVPNGMLSMSSQTGLLEANNTVIGANTSNGGDVCYGIGSSTNVIFLNNISQSCSTLVSVGGNSSFRTDGVDNNIYSNPGTYNGWVFNGQYLSTLTAWQSATRQDKQSKNPPLSKMKLGPDGQPHEGSAVIRTGRNLSDLGCPELLTDKAGRPRQAKGKWDAGAYSI